jgi:DNA-binding NtrC family response regulator
MFHLESDSYEPPHPLILHEMGRRWFDALRGHATRSRVQIRHSAGIHDTLAVVCSERRSTLLIELGRQALESLDLLERVSGFSNEVVSIVVASSDQADLEVPARELGASAFLREPLTGTELARTVTSIVQLQLKWANETRPINPARA